MSVLSCDRKGCGNVMCDRCSPNYGYICNECFDELVASGPDTDIRTFMGQRKTRERSFIDPYQLYDEEFPYR